MSCVLTTPSYSAVSNPRMVSAPDYTLLLDASDHFLEDADFGLDAIEVVMCKVFGQYRDHNKSDGCDAQAWGQYFNEINIYEEAGGEGNMSVEKPLVCPHIICFIMQTANFAQLPTTAVLIDMTEDEDGIMDLDLPSSASTQQHNPVNYLWPLFKNALPIVPLNAPCDAPMATNSLVS